MKSRIPYQRRSGRSIKTFVIGMVIALPVLTGVAILAAYFQSREMKKAIPAIEAQGQFIMLVGSGQVGPAKGMCDASIDEVKLTDMVEQIQSFGTLREIHKYFGGKVHGDHDIEVQTRMDFDSKDKVFIGRWAMPEGVPRLMRYEIIDAPVAPTTQPDSGSSKGPSTRPATPSATNPS